MLESLDDTTKAGIYIFSFLLILSIVIAILVLNSDKEKHYRMFDDDHGLIRIDRKDGVDTIILVSFIAYVMVYLIYISGLGSINKIIPELAQQLTIDIFYLNGIIEMVTLAIVIIGLNVRSHKKMFADSHYERVPKDSKHPSGLKFNMGYIKGDTPEGIATQTFLSLITVILFCLAGKYVTTGSASIFGMVLELINLPILVLPICLSILIWFLKSIYNTFGGFLDISTVRDKSNFVLADFDTNQLPNYGFIFTMIAVITITLYYAAYDPKSLTVNTYVYILAILIPFIFAFYYGAPLIGSNNSSFGKFGMVSLMLLIFAAAIYFFISMNTKSFEATAYISSFIIILILIFGLALLFYLLSNYLKSFTGWTGFIVYFIFYIPCLLIDLFKYLMKELQMTSKVIYVLFFIEILLILIYKYLPYLIDIVHKKDSSQLLRNGVFLDRSLTIGSSDILKIPQEKLENTLSTTVYFTNFSFSMWIYLNIQSPNFSSYTKETSIFNFGNGKPKIVYYNDKSDNDHKNKYKIYFTDITSVSNGNDPCDNCFEITLPNQKWNNFVFNYKSGQADLFINGDLVKVFKFTNNRPIYTATDNIIIGEDNGLDGAICNIQFYPNILTTSHITSMYNLLMYKTPPIII